NYQISEMNPGTLALSVRADNLATLPAGITAGPDSNLWFTDPGANQIGQLTLVYPPVTPMGGFSFNAIVGTDSGTQTLATFTDPNGAQPASDYSASINWGDHTPTSAGTITVNNG